MKIFTAADAVEFAAIAYMPEKEALDAVVNMGFNNSWFYSVDDTQALFTVRKQEPQRIDVVVVFRGTELTDLGDWISNFDAKKIENQNGPGSLHRGFQRELEKVWVGIYQELSKSLKYRNTSIAVYYHFIGHSKAGGIGIQAVGRFMYLNPGMKNVTWWGFGSTRSVTRACAKWLAPQIKAYCFVDYTDPVTWMPPWLWGYRHVGEIIYFEKDGQPTRKPSKWHQIWNGLKAIRRISKFIKAVQRHFLPRYKALVQEHFSERMD